MSVTIPTAVGQKTTIGNTNYISASDGAGKFVWVKDLPDNVNLTPYALNTALGAETVSRTAADTALTTRLDELWKEYATMAWVNSQLDDINGMVNNIPDIIDSKLPASMDLTPYAKTVDLTSEATARTDADTALDARLDALEAKPDPKHALVTDFKTDAPNNQVAQLWDAYSLSLGLNPRHFVDVAELLNFNTTGLQLRRTGYIKSTKEAVFWDRDATAGDYKPNNGPGFWLKASQPVTEAQYFGTWDNQAGDAGATNGGHTCTRRLLRGTGITTSNDSVLNLSSGLYKVRVGVVRHMAYNTWRNTALLVDNTQVETMYTGHDGGNWPGGSVMEWVVDATTVNRTVQVRRVGSVNNGNCTGWLSVEKIAPTVVSSGVSTRTPCSVSVNGGTAFNLFGGTSSRVMATPPAGQQVDSVSASAGLTVSIADPVTGALEVAVAEGTTSGTITTTTGAKPAKSLRTTANAGVWVTLGSLQFAMSAGGNRSFLVRSASGTINVVIHSWTGWDATSQPFTAALTPTSNQYLEPSYGYGNAGNNQFFWIEDTTNNRRYEGVCTVGGAYNNNTFWLKEVT